MARRYIEIRAFQTLTIALIFANMRCLQMQYQQGKTVKISMKKWAFALVIWSQVAVASESWTYSHYLLDHKPIGAGTYGQVYFGSHKKNIKDTIVDKRAKLFYPYDDNDVTKGDILCSSATRELSLLLHLRGSPGVAQLREFRVREKGTDLILDYLPSEIPKKLPYRGRQFEAAVKDLIEALIHLHIVKGVAHRDLKTTNIRLDKDGKVVLFDFGAGRVIARPDSDGVGVEGAYSTGITTIWFKPPELIYPTDSWYDPTALDLWSAGCIIAEWVRGEPLLPGADPTEMMKLIHKFYGLQDRSLNPKSSWASQHAAIVWPRQDAWPTDLDPKYKNLLNILLDPDPKKRRLDQVALQLDIMIPEAKIQEIPPSLEGGGMSISTLEKLNLMKEMLKYTALVRSPIEVYLMAAAIVDQMLISSGKDVTDNLCSLGTASLAISSVWLRIELLQLNTVAHTSGVDVQALKKMITIILSNEAVLRLYPEYPSGELLSKLKRWTTDEEQLAQFLFILLTMSEPIAITKTALYDKVFAIAKAVVSDLSLAEADLLILQKLFVLKEASDFHAKKNQPERSLIQSVAIMILSNPDKAEGWLEKLTQKPGFSASSSLR